MNKLEIFFDYACPYCMKSHGYLEKLIDDYPDIQIEWRPCEAHPRPERHGPHSDLCIQGMFFALESGADIWAYHKLMYKAALTDRINIEDIDTLSDYVSGLLDPNSFREVLKTGKYSNIQQEGNNYAYGQSGVWAVPAYRLNGKKLDAVESIGVTSNQLKAFMDNAK